ncbi:P-loop containing nucleoside triphosphate hydrolase protein, partial [Pavlovales sp. CCMP2436]
STLATCGVDLTAQARRGELDPVHGREEEIERMMQTLVRRRKNNPCLVGDPGVGKTALVEGLAIRMASGDVPPALKGKRLFSLELGLLVADTNRLRWLGRHRACRWISLYNSSFNVRALVGCAGLGATARADGSPYNSSFNVPRLAARRRTGMTCVPSCLIEDPALERRFQPLLVGEPSIEATVGILSALAPAYAQHHGALQPPPPPSQRYIVDRFLPDKAIDLLDEAGALVQVFAVALLVAVTEDDVTAVVSRMTGIPVDRLSAAEAKQLLSLESSLARRVVGQRPAVGALARAIRRLVSVRVCVLYNLFRSSPLIVVGFKRRHFCKRICRSRVCVCAYDNSLKDENSLRTYCVSSYNYSHAGGQLTEAVRRTPHSVVLLDEIEKAHPDVFNALLQVLEDGRLTDGKGRTVDFSNTLLILTSNVGSQQVMNQVGGLQSDGSAEVRAYLRVEQLVKDEMSTRFRPEFLNRLDQLIVFHPLSRANVGQISGLLLKDVLARTADRGVALELSDAMRARLVDEGFDAQYGARPLRRAVQRLVEDVVAE